MKLRLNRLFSRMLSNKGYTIDQTILIVAIIAILITLVIVTVGWQLINRAGGTRAGAQIKQVEDANGQFFSDQRLWVSDAYTAPTVSAKNNMLALVHDAAITTWSAAVDQTRLTNLLPGFRVDATNGVMHTMGAGGAVTEMPGKMTWVSTDLRMVVQFDSVPLADAMEADKAIDGVTGNATGRLIYSTASCLPAASGGNVTAPGAAPASGNVFVCYGANTMQ